MAETAKPVETEPLPEPPLACVDEKQPVEKIDEPKAVPVAEKVPQDATTPKTPKTSLDRDVALAHLEKGKTLSFIKAWEESEKSKANNKAQKKLATVDSWENTKRAALEAKLKKIEEQKEKSKAEYAEKVNNKVALVHKEAQEKKAQIEADRAERILTIHETGAKYIATEQVPKKLLGCF